MSKFLISLAEGAMEIPDDELDTVTSDAHAVVEDAKESGVWIAGGGLRHHTDSATVTVDGTVSDGGGPQGDSALAGFAIVDVESEADAIEWAGRFATACRCAMQVRGLLPESRYDD